MVPILTLVMGLTAGFVRERMIEPQAGPERLLGTAIVLIYRDSPASAAHEAP
jgi:hypothetical protein